MTAVVSLWMFPAQIPSLKNDCFDSFDFRDESQELSELSRSPKGRGTCCSRCKRERESRT